MIGDLCWQLAASTWPSPCCVVFFFSFYFYFYFFLLQIRNLWNEEEDDEERDEIILVLVIYGFGLCWVCIVFEEIYGTRRKMTKREMGNYFGFGFGLCSYVLFWFVLGL